MVRWQSARLLKSNDGIEPFLSLDESNVFPTPTPTAGAAPALRNRQSRVLLLYYAGKAPDGILTRDLSDENRMHLDAMLQKQKMILGIEPRA